MTGIRQPISFETLPIEEVQAIVNASLSEKQFQAQVREMAGRLGWLVFCTYNSRHSPEGDLDLRLVRPPRVLFVELKTERGQLTPAQSATIEALKDCPGVEVYLFRPSDWLLITETLTR